MKHRFVLGLTLASAFVATGASAIDGKSYPPSMCTAGVGGPGYAWNHSITNAYFYNPTGQTQSITCPIVRDFEGTTSGLNWAAAWVYNPSGRTTSCTLYSVNVDGVSLDWSTKSTSAAGAQALYFGSEVNVSNVWSHYSLVCSLPTTGMFRGYTIYEET